VARQNKRQKSEISHENENENDARKKKASLRRIRIATTERAATSANNSMQSFGQKRLSNFHEKLPVKTSLGIVSVINGL
jgi:hypothetical protein